MYEISTILDRYEDKCVNVCEKTIIFHVVNNFCITN